MNISKREKMLAEEQIPRLLFSFSLPAIVGMVAQALYNIIDRAFVGHAIGANGIAGTTVCFPFMAVMMAFGMLVGFGSAALVSIRLGEKRREEAEKVLGRAVLMFSITAITLTVIGSIFLDPLLTLFGASPTVLPYAHDYMQIIVWGSVFQTFGFGLNALIRGEGNPRMAMVTMLISVVLNVALAPLFIFGLHWGMRGAALATVISQAVSAIWVTSYFLSGRSLLRLKWANIGLDKSTCRAIIAVGSPPFAMQMASSVTNTILNHGLRNYGGDLAISVMGIIFAISMLIGMPIIGINQGAQPIIGFNYGARRFDRVKSTLQTAVFAASTIATVGCILALVFPANIIRIFSAGDTQLMAMGSHAIRSCFIMLPVIGFQITSAGYFQAVGKPRHSMLLSLSRQVLILIPAVILLPRFYGLNGIWAALPVADLLSAVWTAIWLSREIKLLNTRHCETVGALVT